MRHRAIAPAEVTAAVAKLESHRSHFDRRELLCALADRLPDGADGRSLAAAVDELLASEAVIEIHRGVDLIAPTYYTTPRLWALEKEFIETAQRGRSAGAAVVDEATLAAVLERHRYLGADQREMVSRLLRGGERVVPVAALPGTGKTTALRAAREAWEAAGHPVIGVATARSASGELSDAGVPATSIAALLVRAERWAQNGLQPLAPGTVVLADESSTTATPHAAALAEMVERCGGKLVAIGDPRQIGAVGPGGTYGHLTKVIEPSVLREIRRQRRPVDRRIVELAHAGRGSDALDLLRSEGQLAIADTLPEALGAAVLDWHESFGRGEDAVMIARRNRDVTELNAAAREALVADGRLGEAELAVAGHPFAVGDRVLTRVNTHEVSNRERWEVIGVDQGGCSVELQRIGGDERVVSLDADYLERHTPSGEPALQHAYAMTTYATESKTFERAFALIDAGATQEEFLVSVSRSRGPTVAYGVAAIELTDPELGPGLREISDEAHELRAAAERPAGELAALEVSTRERLAELDEVDLMARRSYLSYELDKLDQPSAERLRLGGVEEQIAEVEGLLDGYTRQLEELAAQRRPDPQELNRVEGAQLIGSQQLERLGEEREALVKTVAAERPASPQREAELRVETAMVEERLTQLRRRQIAAERLQPSAMVEKALGERPREADRAALWNEGVETIYAYRQRHGISSRSGEPLGREPHPGQDRSDWVQSQRRLSQVQAALEHTPVREVERGIAIEL